MLQSLQTLFTTSEPTMSFWSVTLTVLYTFLLGAVISFTYARTQRDGASRNFIITLVMLPAVISIIILLVGSNVARAFSLAGAFSLVRFRSAPGEPKDIAFICFSLAIGLAAGMGMLQYASLFTALLCLFMVVMWAIGRRRRGRSLQRVLKITIPEDMSYEGVFDDLMKRYARRYELQKVRTTGLGSFYELVYTLTLRPDAGEKAFLDDLRCRNGNLDIALLMKAEPAAA